MDITPNKKALRNRLFIERSCGEYARKAAIKLEVSLGHVFSGGVIVPPSG